MAEGGRGAVTPTYILALKLVRQNKTMVTVGDVSPGFVLSFGRVVKAAVVFGLCP
ncbi:MAG TPA: hypothetical protein VK901_16860 [Nitrospiraceae bacterium]|nr:hypothetical protein [Nitrospiraceae bacterium]